MSETGLTINQETEGPYEGIATIVLEQADRPVVVLDEGLIGDLDRALDALPQNLRGLVLASGSERVFVAGADLEAIDGMDDERLAGYIENGSRVFARLTTLAFPTVCAINGAALGGGLELAMHCDGLVAAPMAKAYQVGLPEASLGLCPGWGGTNLLPARMDPATAIEMAATGRTLPFDDAVAAGLFDAVAPDSASLHSTCADWLIAHEAPADGGHDGAPARWIGRSDVAQSVAAALAAVREKLPESGPAKAVTASIEAGLAKGWHAGIETEQRNLVALRSEPEARGALKAFFEKRGKA